MAELFTFVAGKRWEALADWLTTKLVALKNAVADFAAISANTPPIVFDQVQAKPPLQLISIVEATLESAKSIGLRRVGLLGTKFTMQSNFFGDQFAKEGIVVVVPSEHEQQYNHDKLVSEIELGTSNDANRQELLEIISCMKERDNIDAVILGCTELPLILNEGMSKVRFLNTTAIHVAAICQLCMHPA